MATYAEGFISVPSRSLDGQTQLAVQHIVGVSPGRTRDGNPQCTVFMDSGLEVQVFLLQDDVVASIAAELGGKAAIDAAAKQAKQIKAILDRVSLNTKALQDVVDRVGGGT